MSRGQITQENRQKTSREVVKLIKVNTFTSETTIRKGYDHIGPLKEPDKH